MAEDGEQTFSGLGVCEQLGEACDSLGWKNPTKIQVEAIPHALEAESDDTSIGEVKDTLQDRY